MTRFSGYEYIIRTSDHKCTVEFKSDTVEGLKKLEILLQLKNIVERFLFLWSYLVLSVT